jgi:hypothetical protein
LQLKAIKDDMLKANALPILFISSILCILCHIFAVAACGEDAKVLTEQMPSTDDRVIAPPLLNGAVRHDQAGEPLSAGDAKRKSEEAQVSDSPRRYKLSGQKFSSEDFRKMEYGILGMVAVKLPFAAHYLVVKVIPGCPAAEAGIKPGDKQISTNGHVWTSKDTRKTYWHISDGKAGTPVDLVLMRKGELVEFHLTRMNIEDVPNPSLRRLYENMLKHFGAPNPQEDLLAPNPSEAIP